MITDALLQLASAQSMIQASGEVLSTNTVDLSNNVNGDAHREGLSVVFTVDVSAASAGAATVTFQVVASTASSLASPVVLTSSDAIPVADLVAGRRPIRLSLGRNNRLTTLSAAYRYLGCRFLVSGNILTAGAFSANVVQQGQDVGRYYGAGWKAA